VFIPNFLGRVWKERQADPMEDWWELEGTDGARCGSLKVLGQRDGRCEKVNCGVV